MRRCAVLTAAAAVLMILSASCTPPLESPNLKSYTLSGAAYGTADCQFQVDVGQAGGSAFMRVREYGWWLSLTGASKCGYMELQLWTSEGSMTCEWGDGYPHTGVGAACTGSRNGVVGGTWFDVSKVGQLQTAYVVLERAPDILTYIKTYP